MLEFLELLVLVDIVFGFWFFNLFLKLFLFNLFIFFNIMGKNIVIRDVWIMLNIF